MLTEKERRRKNNFAWATITLFRISGASQAYFGSLKGCYLRGNTTVENAYTVK